MEKLLSIAIPTYNREKYLKEELECILPQLLPYKDLVEVVISDNASPETDNTEGMITCLVEKYGIPIDYKKLPSPIYFEDNFKEVVYRTSGKYVHMTGDDDLFAPDFYRVVFDLLKDDYGLIHFNRLEGDGNCSNTRVYDTQREQMIYVGKTADFIRRVMRSPGFMTSLIFRRDCWDIGCEYEKENYYGYHFLGRVYQGALRMNLNSCYYQMPLIVVRNNNHDWGKFFPLYYFAGYSNIFRDIDKFAPGIYESWLSFLHNESKLNSMMIIGAVLNDKEFYRNRRGELIPYMSNIQRRAFDFLLDSRLPSRMLSILYGFYLKYIFRQKV